MAPTPRPISNADIAQALREIGRYLEMEDVPFKPRAFERAAYTLKTLDRPVAEIYDTGGVQALDDLPGVGKVIAARIAEMLETGTIAKLERFRAKTPLDVLHLTALGGIGPKKAQTLWEELGVRSVDDLKQAIGEGRVRALPRFGPVSEQKLLAAVEFYEETGRRRPLGDVLEMAHRIVAALRDVPGIEQAAVVGSIRRHVDTVRDVTLLVAAHDAPRVSRTFEALPEVDALLSRDDPARTVARLANQMDAELRVLEPGRFGAALLCLTGSKRHVLALRELAMRRGLTLDERGVFRDDTLIAARTEAEVYEALGLPWIPPEMREHTGEIELALQGRLPALVEAGGIRGDLHVHTDWSDGSASIADMARAARSAGREYIVITDHTRDLAMTGGLDEERQRAQREEIRRVDRELDGIRVLAGAEVNIRADGSLDMDDAALAALDVVGAAVHSHFDQSRDEVTRRVLRAIENPHVDVLSHPLGRRLGRRRSLDLDLDAVVGACLRTGTVLEIDASPWRLDAPDVLVRKAVEAGVLLTVDSDAHAPAELRYLDVFGVGVARRGWAQHKHVINTLPVGEMLARLKDRGAEF